MPVHVTEIVPVKVPAVVSLKVPAVVSLSAITWSRPRSSALCLIVGGMSRASCSSSAKFSASLSHAEDPMPPRLACVKVFVSSRADGASFNLVSTPLDFKYLSSSEMRFFANFHETACRPMVFMLGLFTTGKSLFQAPGPSNLIASHRAHMVVSNLYRPETLFTFPRSGFCPALLASRWSLANAGKRAKPAGGGRGIRGGGSRKRIA